MKVLLNKCFGGFNFSEEFLAHLKSVHPDVVTDAGLDYGFYNVRDDHRIVTEAISFGLDKASGFCSKLSVDEVPDGCEYHIDEYDGMEHISHTCFTICEDMLKRGLTDQEIETTRKVTYLRVVSEADLWDGEHSAEYAYGC